MKDHVQKSRGIVHNGIFFVGLFFQPQVFRGESKPQFLNKFLTFSLREESLSFFAALLSKVKVRK